MGNTALNRSMVFLLTNKSGGSVAQGDVVIIDSTTAASFTTTTTAGYVAGSVGVVIEPNGIANDATGLVAFGGYVPKVSLSGAASLGDVFKTHTVAKQAVRHNPPLQQGDFGQVLGTGTTPAALLWNFNGQAAGIGGAPDSAEYVTTAANGNLSVEVAIPGLAGSADIAGAGGGGINEEYDTATTGLTWTSAPDTVDSDTTIKSHLYVSKTFSGGTTDTIGYRVFAPAGAFDARTKISHMGLSTGGYDGFALLIANSDNSVMAQVWIMRTAITGAQGFYTAYAFTYESATWTARGSTFPAIFSPIVYLRITRDGSNNLTFYWSHDGLLWYSFATYALTLTVARIGYRFGGQNETCQIASDWLRTDV